MSPVKPEEYVFVTKYNYSPKYDVRDRMLRHLNAARDGRSTFGPNLLAEPDKFKRECLYWMKQAGYVDDWDAHITATITQKGRDFIKDNGYKSLELHSDEEILFKYLHDHKGYPIKLSDIETVSGLGYLTLSELADETRDDVLSDGLQGQHRAIWLKDAVIKDVASMLKSKDFSRLKKKPEYIPATIQTGDNYHFSGVERSVINAGKSSHNVSSISGSEKKEDWLDKFTKPINILYLILSIVVLVMGWQSGILNGCNKMKEQPSSAGQSVRDSVARGK